MKSNTITHHQKRELIRQVIQGTVSRSMFPEVFRSCITWPDRPTEHIEPSPVKIPEANKKRLIRAILTDTLNECDHPELYANLFEIVVNYPPYETNSN